VIGGTAYLFGGEASNEGKPVDNAMHLITLPASGAPADYYAVKAIAAKRPAAEQQAPPAASVPAIKEPSPEPAPKTEKDTLGRSTMNAEGKEKDLDDVSLASPPPVAAPEPPLPTTSDKGKQPETASPKSHLGLGEVPSARAGHATAAIGHRIFLFGGRSGAATSEPLDEGGRVWVFDTRTNAWSYLDPEPPQSLSSPIVSPVGLRTANAPSPRTYHSAVATDKPRDFNPQRPKRTGSWKEWAKGDSDVVGIPQRQIIGNVAASSRDEDLDGYGTLIIHGGVLANKQLTNDVWAFDVHSRVWRQLPPAPGSPRSGASLCISKSTLYRFGGFNGQAVEGGQVDLLRLGVDFLDGAKGHMEVELANAEEWFSITQGKTVKFADDDPAIRPLAGHTDWPTGRSSAGLEVLTAGGGREYLMLVAGRQQASPATLGEATESQVFNDIWAFQAPPLGMSAASVTDAVLQAIGRSSGEGTWYKVAMAPYDPDEEVVGYVDFPARGLAATAAYSEENAIVVWGGSAPGQNQLGDGWILRLA
jgi:hypothetical protein